jgi:hypothetical protein
MGTAGDPPSDAPPAPTAEPPLDAPPAPTADAPLDSCPTPTAAPPHAAPAAPKAAAAAVPPPEQRAGCLPMDLLRIKQHVFLLKGHDELQEHLQALYFQQHGAGANGTHLVTGALALRHMVAPKEWAAVSVSRAAGQQLLSCLDC